MITPELIGTDPQFDRKLFLLGALGVQELLSGFKLSNEPFVCLLVWDSAAESVESVHSVAALLADSACRSLGVFGDGGPRLLDSIAASSVADEACASTSVSSLRIDWNCGSLDQSLTSLLQAAATEPSGQTDCRYGIAIVIGASRERLQYVRDAMSDHVAARPSVASKSAETPQQEAAPRHHAHVASIEGSDSPEGEPGSSLADEHDQDHEYEWRHSGFGVASFCLTLVMGLFFLIAFGMAGLHTIPGVVEMDEDSPWIVLLGLMVLGSFFGNLLAIALGVVGLLEKRRKKAFAVLGTVMSSVSVLLVIILIVVMILMDQA